MIFLSVYAEMVSNILITMTAGAGCGHTHYFFSHDVSIFSKKHDG